MNREKSAVRGAEPDQIIKVDRWTNYAWNRFLDSDRRALELLERGSLKMRSFPRFVREVFARVYDDDVEDVEQVRPEHRWAQDAHRELTDLPEFDRLRRRCRGDRVTAGECACSFAEVILEGLPEQVFEDPEPLREQVRGLIEFAKRVNGTASQEISKAVEEVRRKGRDLVEAAVAYPASLDVSELRSDLRRACVVAWSAADEVESHTAAFSGWGDGVAASGTSVNVEVKAELARQVRSSPKLKRIANEAGRLRRMAASKRRSRVEKEGGEVVDIECGRALDRLLTSELIRMADPALLLDFFRRYLEGGLLQYQLEERPTLGRGPLVVLLDQSSSMEGPKEIWSKGLTLALLQIATMQKRWCRVVHFNTQAVDVTDWDPHDIDPCALARSMDRFLGGGTAFEPPLREALDAIRLEPNLRGADVVLVTDGEAELSASFMLEWAEMKRRFAFTCYAIHIDDAGVPVTFQLEQIADRVVRLADVAEDSDAAEAVLAI